MGMGEDFLVEGYPPKTLPDAVGEPIVSHLEWEGLGENGKVL